MKTERSFSGWIAALTVTVTLTLTFLAVDKYLTQSKFGLWQLAQQTEYSDWFGSHREIQVGLLEQAATCVAPPIHSPNRIVSSSTAQRRSPTASTGISQLLRRPPEPASGAVLREPLTAEDFVTLPLTQGSSSLGLLMDSMEAALESPMRVVGLSSFQESEPPTSLDKATLAEAMQHSPAAMSNLFPAPTQLLVELDQLRTSLADLQAQTDTSSMPQLNDPQSPHYVGARVTGHGLLPEVATWLHETSRLIHLLTTEQVLDSQLSRPSLDALRKLSGQGIPLGEQLQNDQLAQMLIRTAYSVQRRVEVWQAVQACVDDASIKILRPQSAQESLSQLTSAISEVDSLLAGSADGESWRSFLLLHELKEWTQSSREEWRVGNQLARKFLSRIRWQQLDEPQQNFLQHEKIRKLTSLLAAWNRDPIDYRHLLVSIEQVEQSGPSRLANSVADTIQVLGTSDKLSQQQLAEKLNSHYRNANLRLTVSQELVERFLPEAQHEIRPVRKNILGAQTSGDSTVRTRLSVKFLPDPQHWNMELGVVGDVVSNTSSSKGPAIFHNTGVAHVESRRFLRIGQEGYTISSSPTEVASQDFLNRMSTDFDGLPIIGEFVRLIAREQFNQKRGIAKRITQRMIAEETDSELDRKLEEGLKQYEQQLQQRILGPLDRLRLDPMVVSMSTTQDRLGIRYRLAHESQLTAFTPRPRAPSDSLLSFQVHQSALNNTLDRIGLSGRAWTLTELYQHLGGFLQAKLTPPDDVPHDITVRFADRNPVSINMADGHLRLNLRIAEFSRAEGLSVRNFIVTSTYIPLAEGLDAGLVRDPDGVVEIQGKNLAIRDRLALRVIFAKVFVSKPKISLISPAWQADPKAKGMAISQLEIRDGWMAVALSASDSGMAAEVADRSRQTRAKLQ